MEGEFAGWAYGYLVGCFLSIMVLLYCCLTDDVRSTTNGGKFGVAEWKWLDWTLKGNKASGEFFTGNGAKADGWSVEQANMDKFTPKPPYGGAE